MKKIIYKHTNNEVAVVNIVDGISDTLESLVPRVVPSNHEWAIIEEKEIPIDRTFRDAWIFKNKSISVDIEKAKEIWRDRYREVRSSLLVSLDIEFMKAVESGNVKLQQEIAFKKQALRDITQIPLPDDIEGIKNTWPEILNLVSK